MRRLTAPMVIAVVVAILVGGAREGTEVTSNESPWPLNAVCDVSDTLSWGVGDNGVIAKKVRGCWVLDTLLIGRLGSLSNSDFTGVFFWDERHGWIVGNRQENDERSKAMVLRTIDGGENWEVRFPFVPEGSRLLKVTFGTRYHGWILAENGYMLLTNDGGITWVPTRAGHSVDSVGRGWSVKVGS